MTVVATAIKINWSSVLFQILKAIVSLERQSQGFYIPLSLLFEDVGVALIKTVILHNLKTLSAQNVFAFMPKVQALNIFPAGLLKVKREIKDALASAQKFTCDKKSSNAQVSNPKETGTSI